MNIIVSIQPKQENGLREKEVYNFNSIEERFNPAEAREWFKSRAQKIKLCDWCMQFQSSRSKRMV